MTDKYRSAMTDKYRISRGKANEIKEHAAKIQLVEIYHPDLFGIWETYWGFVFDEERRIDLPEKKMMSSKAYRVAYFKEYKEVPPSMNRAAWKYFLEILDPFDRTVKRCNAAN